MFSCRLLEQRVADHVAHVHLVAAREPGHATWRRGSASSAAPRAPGPRRAARAGDGPSASMLAGRPSLAGVPVADHARASTRVRAVTFVFDIVVLGLPEHEPREARAARRAARGRASTATTMFSDVGMTPRMNATSRLRLRWSTWSTTSRSTIRLSVAEVDHVAGRARRSRPPPTPRACSCARASSGCCTCRTGGRSRRRRARDCARGARR